MRLLPASKRITIARVQRVVKRSLNMVFARARGWALFGLVFAVVGLNGLFNLISPPEMSERARALVVQVFPA